MAKKAPISRTLSGRSQLQLKDKAHNLKLFFSPSKHEKLLKNREQTVPQKSAGKKEELIPCRIAIVNCNSLTRDSDDVIDY